MTGKVQIQVIQQGDSVAGNEGYMLVNGGDVVAFYLDGWGKTGRIYPVMTCSSTYLDGMIHDYPSMHIEDGESDGVTEIAFPEFVGFDVHSVSGGKTMAICLVRRTAYFGKSKNDNLL